MSFIDYHVLEMNHHKQQSVVQRHSLSHKDINRLRALIDERWQEVWQAAKLRNSTTALERRPNFEL
jgi:hypothetical protein